MNNEDILISNIQRFSLHDGPGIRTTVFLMGCGLKCPWCANPENQKSEIQEYTYNKQIGIYGKYISSTELINECLKDKAFYCPGGVTFSGGEPLLQIDRLGDVCKGLRQNDIHLAVETSLFVSKSSVDIAIKYIDLFIVDVKILDNTLAKRIQGQELEGYLNNLDYLVNSGKTIVFRIPVIAGYTDSKDNQFEVTKLVKKYRDKIDKVEIIAGHNLGNSKNHSLGKMVTENFTVTNQVLDSYYEVIKKTGVPTFKCVI